MSILLMGKEMGKMGKKGGGGIFQPRLAVQLLKSCPLKQWIALRSWIEHSSKYDTAQKAMSLTFLLCSIGHQNSKVPNTQNVTLPCSNCTAVGVLMVN